MVICLERGADLHTAQLMPLTLTVFRFSKIQIGFTFLVPAYPVVPEKWPSNGCVCVCVCITSTSCLLPTLCLPHLKTFHVSRMVATLHCSLFLKNTKKQLICANNFDKHMPTVAILSLTRFPNKFGMLKKHLVLYHTPCRTFLHTCATTAEGHLFRKA